ncbi:hydrogen peroxide-inducible genes activator [Methylophaga sulfidovorans]|uniref:Transcriptional regulator, LysR family n=1 Tax=Methylophaga sulfidovorans TaxID=45496 RepID=A0A1I3W7T4_9GAMM|nr:hydrogen peroxide-inducible genes activator [Methylophaga sulfidovorans]SFK02516.1 transcriptional regulator, LysR family [Methylophaga sulfidovorans]
MISLKQLRYALMVEETLHFKKAAEQCNISPSALSTSLNELEQRLGLQIFERDNKKVLVTPIGKRVLLQARSIMLQAEDLQNFAETQKSPFSYPLSIGMIPTIAPYLLPKLLPALKQNYPLAQINIFENQSHILVDKVKRGELDTAILALPFPCEGLLEMPFWDEDFYLITRKNESTSYGSEITSDKLNLSHLLLLEEGHCLKDHIIDACHMSVNTINQSFRATSLNTLIQMVINNLGSTLIPEMAIEQLKSHYPDLAVIHLNEPGPHRQLAFIMRPNFTRLNSIEKLMEMAKTVLDKQCSK